MEEVEIERKYECEVVRDWAEPLSRERKESHSASSYSLKSSRATAVETCIGK